MEVNRLGIGEVIAGGSALVLFIVMFLPWFALGGAAGEVLEQARELGFASDIQTTATAWEAFDLIDLALLVTVLAALGMTLAAALASTSALPVAASAIVTGLGILATILVVYRVIDPVGGDDVERRFWLWVGLLAAAGIAYGGWRSMQEDGSGLDAEGDRLGGRMEGGPPPPPSSQGPAA